MIICSFFLFGHHHSLKGAIELWELDFQRMYSYALIVYCMSALIPCKLLELASSSYIHLLDLTMANLKLYLAVFTQDT